MSLLPVVGGDMEMDEVQNPLIGADACRVFVPVVVVGQMTFITALIDVSSALRPSVHPSVRRDTRTGRDGGSSAQMASFFGNCCFWCLVCPSSVAFSLFGAVHK